LFAVLGERSQLAVLCNSADLSPRPFPVIPFRDVVGNGWEKRLYLAFVCAHRRASQHLLDAEVVNRFNKSLDAD
jgi:hypothetical protein